MRRWPRRALSFLLVAGAAGACREAPRAPPEPQSRAASAAARAATSPAASVAPEPVASLRPPARVAELVEVGLYRFRATSFRRCAAAPGDKPTIAVAVEVAAQASDFFVAPRDLALEKDGVIFASTASPKLPKECGTPLAPIQLRPGQSTSGSVVFELPSETDLAGAKLSYKPTRWGGAPTATVSVPEKI